jgi:hypothetical protein
MKAEGTVGAPTCFIWQMCYVLRAGYLSIPELNYAFSPLVPARHSVRRPGLMGEKFEHGIADRCEHLGYNRKMVPRWLKIFE